MIAGVVATVVIAGVMLVIAKFSFGGESEYEQQIARQKEILLNDEPKSKGAAEKKKPSKEKKKEKKGMLWLTRWMVESSMETIWEYCSYWWDNEWCR